MNELPIDAFQKEIEYTIAKNPITILTAETGAGKSTRVPLWMWQKKKIVHVTQPRRIAARSLSHYLAHLTRKSLGQEIGYQTGFDSRQSKATTLLYVTDGVQMVREIKRRRDYDVLILDEIHEWNLNQEVLVGMVKQQLENGYLKKTGKRIVIMSATLQADRLSSFLDDAPVISVPGRGFPVTMHHNNPHFLLPDTAQMVELERNVLVFQPGKQEIETFIDDLERMLKAEKLKAKILPLHSELSLKEQALVFEHYNLPKVIVATDIAQTSLTIDDIDAVVDCGIKKELRLVRGIEGLYPVDISGSECMQRAGRAGRVKAGQYFLCADAGIKDRIAFPEPEIQRLNLESVTLRLIKMGISPLEFPFFHLPAKALIFKAIRQLKLLGAINEDNTITEDGHKMAELPVSLRSARMLLEAQKVNPVTVDSALKCIAILETRGIVSKEYSGEKVASLAHNSDLLNQLIIWNSARIYRNIISGKKFFLAQEVYRELKKRIQLPQVKKNISLTDLDALYRAILSSFADEFHIRGGDDYQRENEFRQLERNSVLYQTKPEMLVGLPFDLVITRENRLTFEMEQVFIPLVTFASELSLQLLEKLQPFSFSKQEKFFIQNNKILVFREFFFGGRVIKSMTSPPNWDIPEEKEKAIPAILEWFEANSERFELTHCLQQQEELYNDAKNVIEGKLKPFQFYRTQFLEKEIRDNINIEDLNLFFNINKGFTRISLKRILPPWCIRDLKKAAWPSLFFIASIGQALEVTYIERKPYITLDYPLFEKINEDELLLPTGEWLGVIFIDLKCDTWDEMVIQFNRWRRNDLFEKKYKELKKPGNMDDLLTIPFPQVFEAGKGKDNSPFEYYIAPLIEEGEVYLIHFPDLESAQTYYNPIHEAWLEYVKQYKKSKIEDIFKQKGWKVK